MHANNVRATLYRQQGCGNAGHHSLIDLHASHGTQRRFARPPCQQGVTVSQKLRLVCQKREILLHCFTETHSRVQHDATWLYAHRAQ